MTSPVDATPKTLPFDAATFFAQSMDMCVVYDARGRFVYINAAGATMLGRSCDTLLGKTMGDVYGERAGQMAMCVGQALVGNEAPHVVHKIRSSGGGRIYLDTTYTPIRGEDGKVEFVIAIGRDVTDTSARFRELEDTVARRTRDLT